MFTNCTRHEAGVAVSRLTEYIDVCGSRVAPVCEVRPSSGSYADLVTKLVLAKRFVIARYVIHLFCRLGEANIVLRVDRKRLLPQYPS